MQIQLKEKVTTKIQYGLRVAAGRVAAAMLAALLAAPIAATAQAQNYPQRPVRMIVPFGAGGSYDSIGRFFANYLGERLGQRVLVENRGGGGGTVGSEAAARAAPDGYTLLFTSLSTWGITSADAKRLTYSPEKDFTPLAIVGSSANSFVVHPSVTAASVKELIELVRANPGKLRYCSPGVGSGPHIIGELFRHRFKLNIQHVPYRTGGLGIIDLLSGQIEMCISGISTVASRVRSGQLRALAVIGAARSALLPEVPTMAEAGVGDFVFEIIFGMLAPAGVAPEIVARVTREIVAVTQLPEFRSRLVELGSDPAETLTGEAFGRFMAGEARRWREISALGGM